MQDLSKEEWKERIAGDENSFLLDVRTAEEFEEGHIPGALNADIYQSGEFMEELSNLDKNKNYYVYCKSGGRSAQACQVMDNLGFNNTYNLKGGFSEWDGATSNDE